MVLFSRFGLAGFLGFSSFVTFGVAWVCLVYCFCVWVLVLLIVTGFLVCFLGFASGLVCATVVW